MVRAEGRAALAAAAAALLMSTAGLFVKLAPMPALAIVFGRAVITSLFFVAVFRPRLSEARWSTAGCYAGMVIGFVCATRLTTAANAAFLQYTGPLYVLALAPFFLKEKFRRLDAVCVVVALAGMSLILTESPPGHRLGDLVALASGAFYGFTMLLLRRDATAGKVAEGVRGGTPMASTLLGNILAAVVVLPFAASDVPGALTTRGLLVLLYLGVVQLGLGYVFLNRALHRLPASTVSVIMMTEPVMNPLWVFLGLGELPTGRALAGGVIVLGAVTVRSLIKT